MKSLQKGLTYVFVVILGVLGCIDPFTPPEINSTRQFLVFDGYMNVNGVDTSWIRLTLTQNFSQLGSPQSVSGASVQVEGDKGVAYNFLSDPQNPGSYFLPPQTVDLNQKYRISIRVNGKTFQSEWQPFMVSPPIDSLTYERKGDHGIQIYVHTHDPSQKSRFYKWTFEETWEYQTPLISTMELVDRKVIDRIIPIHQCWKEETSNRINLFTTAAHIQDVVLYHPITYVSAASNKLLRGYSIKVNQQTLTRQAYDFWSELAKNNETNGSIFDPFPSQLTGNIRCVEDPQEKVFGYFNGGEIRSERLFVREWMGTYPICSHIDTLNRDELSLSDNLIAHEIPKLELFITADATCLDCRTQGGTLKKPSFWP